MGCCATGTCPPDCKFCARMKRLFPLPIVACGKETDRGPCTLVKGHPKWSRCRGKGPEKIEANPARDGDPKLAAERKRGNLAFEKRRRVGPHRGNA